MKNCSVPSKSFLTMLPLDLHSVILSFVENDKEFINAATALGRPDLVSLFEDLSVKCKTHITASSVIVEDLPFAFCQIALRLSALSKKKLVIKLASLDHVHLFHGKPCEIVLELQSCSFEDLAEAMMHSNNRLVSLNLVDNHIRHEGAKSLAEAMMHENNHLTCLDSMNNKIRDEGVKSIAEALTHENNHLTSLNLAFNEIGVEGAKSLAEAMMHENNHLTSLYLEYNRIG